MNSRWQKIIAVVGLGAILFGFSIGFHVIPFDAVNWLLVYQDPSNHLLGWLFYQGSPWSFPPGSTSLMLAPLGGSVAQTDSLPLWALIFKIFSFALPYPSQYFGLALFVSYLGLGLAGARYFFNRVRDANYFVLIAVAILFCSPVFFNRLTNLTPHIALTFQFLIILVIDFWNIEHETEIRWQRAWTMSAVILIASLIHPVLWFMTLSLHVPMMLYFGWRQKKLKLGLAHSITGLGLSFLFLKMAGALGPGDPATFGFGLYSANLLTFIDPNQAARIMPDLPSENYQWEGMAYLGLGILILLAWQLVRWLRIQWPEPKLRIHHSPSTIVWIWAVVLAVFSLSQKVMIGHELMMDLSFLYDHLGFLTGPFRSSGRFIWPLYYLIVLYCLTASLRPKSAWRWLLVGIFFVQAYDVLPVMDHGPINSWQPLELKQIVRDEDFKNVQLIKFFPPTAIYGEYFQECQPFPAVPYPDFVTIALNAIPKGIALNSGMASRSPAQNLKADCVATLAELSGKAPASKQTLYVVSTKLLQPEPKVHLQNMTCAQRGETTLCRAVSASQ